MMGVFKLLNQNGRRVVGGASAAVTYGLRSWPVLVVYVALLFSFIAPGMLQGQTLQALAGYDAIPHLEARPWIRFLLSVGIAWALGSCLVRSTNDLSRDKHLNSSDVVRHRVAVVHRCAPALCLSLGLFQATTYSSTGAPVYALLGTATMALTMAFLVVRRRLLLRIERHARYPRIGSALRRTWPLILGTALVLLFSVDRETCVDAARLLGPVGLLLLFLLVFCGMATSLVNAGRKLGVPLLLVLIVCAVLFGWFDLNDNHPVRSVERTIQEKPVGVQDSFRSWLASRPENAHFSEYPVLMVSAEGGGIRAAFFTAVTLSRMADRCPALANHIFAISGVSGGSVGATVYAAAMDAWPLIQGDERCDFSDAAAPARYEAAVAEVLGDDHLSPLMARALFPDLLQRFLPFPVAAFDRQRGLEWSLEASFKRVFGVDQLSQSLYRLRPSKARPAVPFLLLNTTEVETGKRVVITPLFLNSEEFGGAEDWHWYDGDFGPTLSSAATTSARFPYLSPAGYQHSQGRKARYVDGGYFDNSGVTSLLEVYKALYVLREQEFVSKADSSDVRYALFAVHIGNAQACDKATFRSDKSKLTPRARLTCERETGYAAASGVGELASPLQTLINVRDAQVEYNLGRFEAEISRATEFNRFDFSGRIQMVDRSMPVPLGWLLSKSVAAELRSQLDPLPGEGRCKAKDVAANLCQLKGIAGVQTWRDYPASAPR